jgi:DNA-binding response OmpR family regulator
MASDTRILVVEPDASLAQLVAVSCERARPGTAVVFATLEEAFALSPAPRLVVLGASISPRLRSRDIARLRAALPGAPVLALVAADASPPEGVDAAYVMADEWQALCANVEKLLREWA